LADTDSKITKSYGALDDDDRVTRSTFIIGPDGKIAAVWGKVFGFNEHAQQVLDKLKEITNGGQEKGGEDNNDDDDDNDDNDNNNNNNDDDDDDE
jgi:alkyl hydroperoxide reductase subunit AhpC